MTTAYEVPLTAEPQQFFIELAGTTYSFTLRWNTQALCWVLDIADVDKVPIVSGIALVTGVDLLSQYEYLALGGRLIVQTDFDADAVPTFDNLGSAGRLYFVVE